MDYLYFLTFLLWIVVLTCQFGSSISLKDRTLPYLKQPLSTDGLEVKGFLVPLLPAYIARYEVKLVPNFLREPGDDTKIPIVVNRGIEPNLDFVVTAPKAGNYTLHVDLRLEPATSSCKDTVCINEHGGCESHCFQEQYRVKVSALSCGPVMPPQYGSVGYTNDYKVGSTATFTCSTGWRLARNVVTNTTCLPSGEWSYKPPDCQIVTCGTPPPVVHSNIASKSEDFDSTAVYSCHTNYRMEKGSSIRRCQEDGNWSGSVVCTEVTCEISEASPHPQHGKVTVKSTKIGAKARYMCNKGYKLHGNDTRRCSEDGEWAGVMPNCLEEEPVKTPLSTSQTVVTVVGAFIGSVVVLGIVGACCFKKHCRKQPNNENKNSSPRDYIQIPAKDPLELPDFPGDSVSFTGIYCEPPSYPVREGAEQRHSVASSLGPDNITAIIDDIINYTKVNCERDRSDTDTTL